MQRYKRNLLIGSFDEKLQKKIADTKVLVCGAGGLGSSVLVNLAGLGVINIGIMDFDVVEIHNLNRQFIHSEKNISKLKTQSAKEYLLNFNSSLQVDLFDIKFAGSNCDEIISKYDIIVDCFDSYSSKFELLKACLRLNKTLVHGGVQEYFGQVMVVDNQSSCYQCFLSENIDVKQKKGIISPVVSIIGSIQAMEVFKIIANKDDVLKNTILFYDGIKCDFKKIAVDKNPNCKMCN